MRIEKENCCQDFCCFFSSFFFWHSLSSLSFLLYDSSTDSTRNQHFGFLLFIWLGWDEDLFTWPGPSLALFTPVLWSRKLNCKLQSWHFGPRPWRFHLYDRPKQPTNWLTLLDLQLRLCLLKLRAGTGHKAPGSSSRSPFGFWIYILCRVLTFENALNCNLY